MSVIPVDNEPLDGVVDDKPAWMVVHLRMHKNQAIGDHFDGNAGGGAICRKPIRRPRSSSLGSQTRGKQNWYWGASYKGH
ncbi:MAG: hypothetical protein WCA20_30640 [Candidatus Sulfotelmatobacter sp.]